MWSKSPEYGKEQIEGIKQVGATVPGVTGLLGSCACFCKFVPGARGSGKNKSLVLLQTLTHLANKSSDFLVFFYTL